MVKLENICIRTPICERILGLGVDYSQEYRVTKISHPAPVRADGEDYKMIGFTKVNGDPSYGMTIDYCANADHGLEEGSIITGAELFEHTSEYKMTNPHFGW